jgi:hypothetical protein
MEAIIHLKGQSEDIVRFAQLILQAAKLFRTEAELGSKSKDDWDVIFERQIMFGAADGFGPPQLD